MDICQCTSHKCSTLLVRFSCAWTVMSLRNSTNKNCSLQNRCNNRNRKVRNVSVDLGLQQTTAVWVACPLWL